MSRTALVTAVHPDYLEPPQEGWAPADALTGLLARITTGELYAFTGRFLRAAAGDPPGPGADGGTPRHVPYE